MRTVKQNLSTVWIVQPTPKFNSRSQDGPGLISEVFALTKALPGTKISGSSIVKIEKPSPKEFFGKGKVEELSSIFKLNKIQLVIINSHYTTANLEKNGRLKY